MPYEETALHPRHRHHPFATRGKHRKGLLAEIPSKDIGKTKGNINGHTDNRAKVLRSLVKAASIAPQQGHPSQPKLRQSSKRNSSDFHAGCTMPGHGPDPHQHSEPGTKESQECWNQKSFT